MAEALRMFESSEDESDFEGFLKGKSEFRTT
jgi:hypothetical protein